MSLRCYKLVAGFLLLFLTSGAFAASGFIVGSSIKRGTNIAEISIQLACAVEYVDHLPTERTDRLRIQIESTTICNGVSPTIASTRELHRPLDADRAKLVEISYDGDTSAGQSLTLTFTEDVSFEIVHQGTTNDMVVRVYLNQVVERPVPETRAPSVRVTRTPDPQSLYVINLSSGRVQHAESEIQALTATPGLKVFESEVVLAGITWYRLRLGYFKTSADAQAQLAKLRNQYPTAWIDRAKETAAEIAAAESSNPDDAVITESNAAFASIGLDEIDQLMDDARRAMVAGEISRAVQIYTKVLRAPNHDRHAQAQEYLALAREKNGQKAHARAEYQRYLSLYPDGEGAARVSQRLAALLASDRKISQPASNADNTKVVQAKSRQADWRVQTFFSQYYRRDVNQPNEEEDIVSQSSLYSDINIDARRRGRRFDFSSRLSAGYRNDFLDEGEGSGNDMRISYAYADLADAETGLTARIGRQSRNTGGVLGRFDGLNVSYQATEQVLLDTVIGIPVNSSSDGIDSERNFYGLSASYAPPIENLELGTFFIAQTIEGLDDRQAIGGEFRYFGEKQNLWGMIDYDTLYNELGSAFLQGSWRVSPRLSVHGSANRRYSPYLSTRNSMIGQPVTSFSEMLILWSPEEIHQLSLDRSPQSSSYSVGLSQSFSPKLQINFDANQTTIDATPASGGIEATQESSFRYLSTTLVASSLIKEGDVSMMTFRVSDSDSTKVISLNLDSRFPLGDSWRINPRLRVDRREIMSDGSHEWIYTPGIRIQLRHSRKYRFEFEAGKRFSQRQSGLIDLDRESYFVNLGYQAFF
jgi:tetratricopeptide (TPR) repeat protein